MFPRFFVKKLIFLEFLGYGMQIEGKQNTISTMAKCDLVIKNWKRTNQRMYRLEVAMTIFMRCEDLWKKRLGVWLIVVPHPNLCKMKKWH